MFRTKCSITDCETYVYVKSYCQKHYARYMKYGDPHRVAKIVTGTRSIHPLYKLYYAMLDRCKNPNHKHYDYYGGRGIRVCARWQGLYGFDHFVKDMGERPEGMTIDRINNNEGYSPDNCRWSTRTNQQYNQRIARTNTSGHKGVTLYRNGKWTAQMYKKRKKIHLGYFKTIEEAVEARKKAELQLRKEQNDRQTINMAGQA
jgi:hypothetical protein